MALERRNIIRIERQSDQDAVAAHNHAVTMFGPVVNGPYLHKAMHEQRIPARRQLIIFNHLSIPLPPARIPVNFNH